MVANAIEFEARIDSDYKISIPMEYREYLPSFSRVILLNFGVNFVAQKEKESDVQTRLSAFNRLDGLLEGHNIDLDNIRKERLARQ